MDALAMYNNTVSSLRRAIEQHKVPAPLRPSIDAFCKVEGFSRQNLTKIFGGKHTLSVGLFMRLAGALGTAPRREVPAGLDTISLLTWLEVDSFAVQQAMYGVNFA